MLIHDFGACSGEVADVSGCDHNLLACTRELNMQTECHVGACTGEVADMSG